MSSCGFLAPLVGQCHRVAEDLHERDRLVALHLGIVVGHHLVGPLEELAAVLLRYAEQPGDRLERELGRDVLDEVALTLGDRLRDDVAGAALQVLVQRRDGPRRERARDDLAQLGVVGCVVVDQQEPGVDDALAIHVRTEPDDHAIEVGGEVRLVLRDGRHVGVLAHRPVAAVLGEAGAGLGRLLDERDGRRTPQRQQLLVRDPLPHHVGVGRVESGPGGLGRLAQRWLLAPFLAALNLERVLVGEVTYSR